MCDLKATQEYMCIRAELQGLTCRTTACTEHCVNMQHKTAGQWIESCNDSQQITPEPARTAEALILKQKLGIGTFSLPCKCHNPLLLPAPASFSSLIRKALVCSLSFKDLLFFYLRKKIYLPSAYSIGQ